MAGHVLRFPSRDPLETVLAAVAALDRGQLEQVQQQVQVLLAALPTPVDPAPGRRGQRRPAQGWLELRFVRDRASGRVYGPYVYRRWREGRRQRTQYVGKVGRVGRPALPAAPGPETPKS